MKREQKLIKEVKKWQKMLREENVSLWASENETYMEEKRQLVKSLKSELKGYQKALNDLGDKIRDNRDVKNDPEYEKGFEEWDGGYDACLNMLEEYTG